MLGLQFNIISAISLLAGILIVLLGIIIYSTNKKGAANKSFFILTIASCIWILSIVIRINSHDYNLIIISLRSAFSGATLVGMSLFYFSYYFPAKNQYRLKHIFIVVPTGFILLLTIFTSLLIEGAKDVDKTTYGPAYYLFVLYFLVMFGLCFYNQRSKQKSLSGLELIQSRYVLIGLTATLTITLTTNLIIPMVIGTSAYSKYGPLATIFFIIFTAYAITKHHLFNIKVIATEILTALMAIMLLVRIPLSKTTGELAFNLIFFHIFLALGIVLIRTVWLEIHRVQEIEKLNKEKLAAYDRIKAQADDLKQANIDLKKLLATKSKFMDLVSHQLRTPTSAVKGMLSMLVEGGLTPEEREKFIKSTYEASEKLSIIIRDIISATSIESGRLELQLEPTDLGSIINQAVEEHRAPAEQKKLKLNIDIPESLPPIKADEYWLKQVFNGLLDNAIFYTRQGEINVGVKNNSENVTVNIKDTGVGINPEDKKRLFKVFTRGEKSQQVHPDGSGLGLYIAKNIINFHRGAIDIFSEGQGQGTTVEVALPKG